MGRFAGVVHSKNANGTYVVHFDDGDSQTDVKRRQINVLSDQGKVSSKSERIKTLVLLAEKVLEKQVEKPRTPVDQADFKAITVQASAQEMCIPVTPSSVDRSICVYSAEFMRRLFVAGQKLSPAMSATETVRQVTTLCNMIQNGDKDEGIKEKFIDNQVAMPQSIVWPDEASMTLNTTPLDKISKCESSESLKILLQDLTFRDLVIALNVGPSHLLQIDKARSLIDKCFQLFSNYELHHSFPLFEANAPLCATRLVMVLPCFLLATVLHRFRDLKVAKLLKQAMNINQGNVTLLYKHKILFKRFVCGLTSCIVLNVEERLHILRNLTHSRPVLALPPKKRIRMT